MATVITSMAPNVPVDYQGSITVPEVSLPLLPDYGRFTNKYTQIFHTHPTGTLAVFSIADLIAIATFIRKSEIDNEEFVAYLATEKGTYLAITIANPQKLLDLLYYQTIQGENITDNDIDWVKTMTSDEKFRKLYNKYYNPANPNRLIHEDDINNENVLIQFLNFLNDANAGVEVFETDSTFTNFTNLKLKIDGTIDRSQSCP